MISEIYEITLKKAHSNPLSIIGLTIVFENIPREEVRIKADELVEKLGLRFGVSYIIKGYREEV